MAKLQLDEAADLGQLCETVADVMQASDELAPVANAALQRAMAQDEPILLQTLIQNGLAEYELFQQAVRMNAIGCATHLHGLLLEKQFVFTSEDLKLCMVGGDKFVELLAEDGQCLRNLLREMNNVLSFFYDYSLHDPVVMREIKCANFTKTIAAHLVGDMMESHFNGLAINNLCSRMMWIFRARNSSIGDGVVNEFLKDIVETFEIFSKAVSGTLSQLDPLQPIVNILNGTICEYYPGPGLVFPSDETLSRQIWMSLDIIYAVIEFGFSTPEKRIISIARFPTYNFHFYDRDRTQLAIQKYINCFKLCLTSGSRIDSLDGDNEPVFMSFLSRSYEYVLYNCYGYCESASLQIALLLKLVDMFSVAGLNLNAHVEYCNPSTRHETSRRHDTYLQVILAIFTQTKLKDICFYRNSKQLLAAYAILFAQRVDLQREFSLSRIELTVDYLARYAFGRFLNTLDWATEALTEFDNDANGDKNVEQSPVTRATVRLLGFLLPLLHIVNRKALVHQFMVKVGEQVRNKEAVCSLQTYIDWKLGHFLHDAPTLKDITVVTIRSRLYRNLGNDNACSSNTIDIALKDEDYPRTVAQCCTLSGNEEILGKLERYDLFTEGGPTSFEKQIARLDIPRLTKDSILRYNDMLEAVLYILYM